MSEYKKIILKDGKEQSLNRKHLWVFSGAIKHKDEINQGEVVEVYSNKNEFLATGIYDIGSIAVRIISNQKIKPDYQFWLDKIEKAYLYRKNIGIIGNETTNAYRLVHAEGDGIPGLIVDIYNDVAVMQSHTLGIYNFREQIAAALKEVYKDKISVIFDKSEKTLHLEKKDDLEKENTKIKNEYLFGEPKSETVILENGNKFIINWEEGQKTGFFLDQRDNRQLLAQYSKDKTILNTFCYTGGFSVYAACAGAKYVHSVDLSKPAIEIANRNIALNEKENLHQSYTEDIFRFLKEADKEYDVIVLDPPAFAKHNNARHSAIMGYKRINAMAIDKIKPGGILFTFSCSQVVDKYLFASTIMSSAIEVGRNVKIMHQLFQPVDHPVSIFHPEGEYLKGLVLYVE